METKLYMVRNEFVVRNCVDVGGDCSVRGSQGCDVGVESKGCDVDVKGSQGCDVGVGGCQGYNVGVGGSQGCVGV